METTVKNKAYICCFNIQVQLDKNTIKLLLKIIYEPKKVMINTHSRRRKKLIR